MPGEPKLAVDVAVHCVLKQRQGSFLPCLTSIDPTSPFRLEQPCSHQFDLLSAALRRSRRTNLMAYPSPNHDRICREYCENLHTSSRTYTRKPVLHRPCSRHPGSVHRSRQTGIPVPARRQIHSQDWNSEASAARKCSWYFAKPRMGR